MRASSFSRSFVGCVTILLGLGMGCEPLSAALTPMGERVRLSKKDAPRKCRELGTVEAEDTLLEVAQYKLRNAAAELGGNYVRWDRAVPGYQLTGSVFECPPEVME